MSPAVAISGQIGDAAVDRRARQPLGQPGRDDELRTGVDRLAELVRIEHRPGPDDRALDLGHRADRVERCGGAQRHFDHRQARRDQRLGERGGIEPVVDHQHRDHRRDAHDVVDVHSVRLHRGEHRRGAMLGIVGAAPHEREQLAAGAHAAAAARRGIARSRGRRRPPRGFRVCAHSRTTSPSRKLRQRTAAKRFGQTMDRRRHLAARARHPAVGDQRDLEALVLQHAERRGQLVQFGHAVGARPLEADDDHHVAVELARLERGEHLVLVGEDARRRLDRPALGRDRAGLEDRAAEIAARPAASRRRGGRGRSTGRSMSDCSSLGDFVPDQRVAVELAGCRRISARIRRRRPSACRRAAARPRAACGSTNAIPPAWWKSFTSPEPLG